MDGRPLEESRLFSSSVIESTKPHGRRNHRYRIRYRRKYRDFPSSNTVLLQSLP